jgi:hypothetical protein
MTLIMLMAFGHILVNSMSPSARALNNATYVLDLSHMEPGELRVHQISGRQLFTLRPNKAQLSSIDYLDDHVWDKSRASFSKKFGVFIYWGHSTRFNWPLEHHPKDESAPPWWNDREWMGGFWHPWGEVSYDYAGRTISSPKHTYNGFNAKYPNLKVPVMKTIGETLTISLFPPD